MRSRTIRAALRVAFFSSVLSSIPLLAAESNFDPDTGLRIHHYTDPVPDSVPGGVTLSTDDVASLIASTSVVLLDVLSINNVRYDELDGTWPEFPPRQHIKNSLWLPNVGYGKPSSDMLQYLLKQTAKATNNNREHPILVYCISDCWMGWNAVQHLAKAGYENLYWFPEGTDGWIEAGLPLVDAEPVPVDLE